MKDLTEKVATLEKRLDELGDVFDVIRKSLTGGKHGKQRRSVRVEAPSGPPDWVQDIFKCFSEISADLNSVKKTLGTRTFTDSGHTQSDASATYDRAAPEAELQYGAPAPSQSETEPAIPESGQRKSAATDGTEPLGHAFATASPGHVAIAQELPSRPGTEAVHCELALTTSTANPSSLTTQPSSARLQLETETAPTFRCKYEDISKNINIPKLETFSSNSSVKEKGYFKLVVEDLPPLTLDEASFSRPGKDHSTNFSCYRDSQGFVVLSKGQKREVRLPSLPFPQSQRSWSRSELKDFWESTLKEPPTNMHYVIGDSLFSDIELSPGERLERIGGREIRGVGTTYAYICPGISFSICHSEDADFGSINLLRDGAIKLWLFIKPAYNEVLERHMRREFPDMRRCSQALRHLSRVIPPSKLDEWGIEYSLDYCAPGEAIVTERKTFHQVLNMDRNYALATNILYGSSPDIPQDYRFCETSCGPHALTKAHFQLPEKGPLVEVQGNRKARLQPERVAVVQSKFAGMKRKALPTESLSRKTQVTPQMGSLLEVVCGKQAFHQLCSLIYSWRDRSKPFFENNDGRAPAVQLVQAIGALEKRSLLTEFLDRFAKVKLVEIINEGKEGRMRADPDAIANLINGLGWQNSKTNRTKLHHYLVEGRRWKRICDSFDGLLCLIPSNRRDGESLQISGRVCQELSDKDMELLHSFLESNEFVKPMCRMGKTFQASIWSNMEVPEFKWESEDPQRITRLPVEDLATLMEEFPIIEEAEFKVGKYDWPKPDCWLWDWPQSPAWVPPSDKLCDLCDLCKIDKKCNCIITCLPANKPRITNEAGKGQGVRVEGTTYQKGQILEQLAGEFAPVDTYNNGWPMEFRRPDIADEPIAQIYPKEKGNWVRKVNHSCDPSAEFRVIKISGSWRQMLVAIQDIPHNSEVTASL